MTGAINVPLITDADTGFGNPLNVRRTVQEFERAGVTAMQIEDQTFPKRCGHFEGKDVISSAEFEQKVRAAVDSRESDDFLIVARTDAAAVHGIDEAIERAQRYQDAGADINFVEAPTSVEEMERITEEVPGPHIANMATGGKTPVRPADELEDIGYDVALYAAEAFRGAMKTFQEIFNSILENGSQEEVVDDIIDFDKRNETLGFDKWVEYEQEYTAD
jgi:2-methylisocitrate lyase-like PEP mutase family enzyme